MTMPTPTTPYGSAADLPSMRELLDQIRAAKMITLVFARAQRASIVEVERQVIDLCNQVDAFYVLLGERNWIYTDAFRTETIAELVALPAADAERALINWYKEPDTLRYGVTRLRGIPALRPRLHQIQSARDDYIAGRYGATVQGLLSVMDGFVNDVDPVARKGMAARAPEELQAWDSVVGHHLGLAHAHKSFTKTFKKTVNEEVFELYRHGIVHGNILHFDNDIVATKAWNRLFAVADWSKSLEKAAVPKKVEKSWPALLREVADTTNAIKKQRDALAAWRPTVVTPADTAFAHDDVVLRSVEYLNAWMQRNYGLAASCLSPMVAEESHGRTAGRVREELSSQLLGEYTIERVNNSAAAVSEVDVILVINGERTEGRMRWIRVDETGMAASPNVPASWRLMSWGPLEMIGARRRAAS